MGDIREMELIVQALQLMIDQGNFVLEEGDCEANDFVVISQDIADAKELLESIIGKSDYKPPIHLATSGGKLVD